MKNIILTLTPAMQATTGEIGLQKQVVLEAALAIKGDQGDTGPVGETGATGPVGPVGPVGPTGPVGQTGPQGPKGDQGDTGPVGETGATGPVGQTGPQGIQGVAGATGQQGPKGDTGLQGIQGPIGETGPAGPMGSLLGVKTISGTSYTLTVADNGFLLYCTSAIAVTITTASGLGAAFSCMVVQGGAGQITIAQGTGTTVVAYGGMCKTAGQYAALTLITPVADTFLAAGQAS